MKTLSLVIVYLVLARAPIYARIGESLAQLTERFGPPFATIPLPAGGESVIFKFKGVSIAVIVFNGRSASERYDVPDGRPAFSQIDADVILGANSSGKQWKPVTQIDYLGIMHHKANGTGMGEFTFINAWELEGDTLRAIQWRTPASIEVISKEYSDFLADLRRKGREKNVKNSGL
jgi:hypothetical protein